MLLLACMLFFSCNSGYQYSSDMPGMYGRAESGLTEQMLMPGRTAKEAVLQPIARGALLETQGRISGIPGFGRNALGALKGTYAIIEDTAAVFFADLYFYSGPLFFSGESWTREDLDSRSLYVQEADEFRIYALNMEDMYEAGILLVVVPSDSETPVTMSFIRSFSGRFSYFMNRATTLDALSFPAILEW